MKTQITNRTLGSNLMLKNWSRQVERPERQTTAITVTNPANIALAVRMTTPSKVVQDSPTTPPRAKVKLKSLKYWSKKWEREDRIGDPIDPGDEREFIQRLSTNLGRVLLTAAAACCYSLRRGGGNARTL